VQNLVIYAKIDIGLIMMVNSANSKQTNLCCLFIPLVYTKTIKRCSEFSYVIPAYKYIFVTNLKQYNIVRGCLSL